MILTQSDKEQLLGEFPNIKLSYENIAHKKVSKSNFDFLMAVPEGKKCFIWFTVFGEENQNVCLIMELAPNKQIANIRIMNCCFKSELSCGTILYGTLFYQSRNNFFTVEDIFMYKGKDIARAKWGDKLVSIKSFMETDILQRSYSSSFLVFGMPLIGRAYEEIALLPIKYKIYSIQYYQYNRSNNYMFMRYNTFVREETAQPVHVIAPLSPPSPSLPPLPPLPPFSPPLSPPSLSLSPPITQTIAKPIVTRNYQQPKEAVFIVKPEIQNDIYSLYYEDDTFFSTAYIPDYATSVMMNKLFRVIKENNNLDALEESDDEEEFQDEKPDRFVHLNKSYKMVCAFNYKFKKWYPVSTFEKGGAKPTAKSNGPTNQQHIKPGFGSTFSKGGYGGAKSNGPTNQQHIKPGFGSTFSKGGYKYNHK